MNDQAIPISVVICTYTEERWCHLVAAVESIKQQTTPAYEIIVVIDHNHLLLERVRRNIPYVLAIENSEAQGLSGTRNSGIAIAKGEFIAFLDDDAIADRNWLAQLSSNCHDSRVLGVGGVVEPDWSVKQPDWLPKEFYWVIGCTHERFPEVPVEIRNPFGGCLCIRREVFEVVGGFRNGIGRIGTSPFGGEETELCIRAKQYWPQKIFLCDSKAKIYHYVSAQRTTWHYFCSRCYSEGISKAAISRYVGVRDGLASERLYALHVLPKRIVLNIRDGLFAFELKCFLQAVVLLAGLLMTATGYLSGRFEHGFLAPKGGHDDLTMNS